MGIYYTIRYFVNSLAQGPCKPVVHIIRISNLEIRLNSSTGTAQVMLCG